MPPKKKGRQSNKLTAIVRKKHVKFAQEEGFVIIDRFHGKTTENDEDVMTYKLHRIDTPDCSADVDKITKDISEALYHEYWNRQRHSKDDLEHSLPERDMLKKFTNVTKNDVEIVDCHTQGSKDDNTKLFVITLRCAIKTSEIIKILRTYINDNPNAARIVKLCDERFGSSFENDVIIGNGDKIPNENDENEQRAKKARYDSSMSVDQVSVGRATPVVENEMGDPMYGRTEPPVNAAERHLYRLAAVALQCSRDDFDRIRRAKIVQIYDKSGKSIIKDVERIARKKGVNEITVTCPYSSYTDEMAAAIREWQYEVFNESMRAGMIAVDIENTMSDLVPPMNAPHPTTHRFRRYIESREIVGNIKLVDDSTIVHCSCKGKCDEKCPCRPSETQTFECNAKCKCPSLTCGNREVGDMGRRIRLQLRRTKEGTWTVVTLEDIFINELISIYVAQLKPEGDKVINEETARKGAFGHSQLMDLNGGKYVLDSYDAGNIVPYVLHSCYPNCYLWEVWTDTRDPACPNLALYARHNIKKGTPLTFDYVDANLGNQYEKRVRVEAKPNNTFYPMEKCNCGAQECRGDFPEEPTKFEDHEQ